MPKVSVVIPTYDRPLLLERAIESVLNQSFIDHELIVVQNGPEELAKPVVEKFKKIGANIHYVYEKRPCAIHARNVGIQRSKGDYVAFLDDDDEWLLEKLQKQVEIMDRHPRLGLIGCHASVLNDDGKEIEDPRARFDGELNVTALITNMCVVYSFSCALIRRSCFSDVGFLNDKYYIANDYDFYIRLGSKYEMKLIKEPLVKYYRHSGNTIRNYIKTAEENIEVIKSVRPSKALGVTGKMIHDSIERYMRSYAQMNYGLASEALDDKKYRAALQYYGSALLTNPFVGLTISWSRFQNPVYRVLKPYFAALCCGFMALGIKNK